MSDPEAAHPGAPADHITLLTELCEGLGETYDVDVITGVLHEHENEPRHRDPVAGRPRAVLLTWV